MYNNKNSLNDLYVLLEDKSKIKKEFSLIIVDIKNIDYLEHIYTNNIVNTLIGNIKNDLLDKYQSTDIMLLKKNKIIILTSLIFEDIKIESEVIIEKYKSGINIKDINVSIEVDLMIASATKVKNKENIDCLDIYNKANISLIYAAQYKETYLHYDDLLFLDELKNAIVNNEIVNLYQPLVDVNTNMVIGAEALARWDHPIKGILNPSYFIEKAIKYGLIEEIDKMAFKNAVNFLKQLEEANIDIFLSVNISSQSLCNPLFLKFVSDLIVSNKFNPEKIMLEITEQSYMDDIEVSKYNAKQLSKLGFKIGIDDFGAGYSTYSYITTYPCNVLKLDSLLISNIADMPNKQSVVKSIINMADEMGIELIAEGVEMLGDYYYLKTHNCKIIQGFIYSTPISSLELISMSKEEVTPKRYKY